MLIVLILNIGHLLIFMKPQSLEGFQSWGVGFVRLLSEISDQLLSDLVLAKEYIDISPSDIFPQAFPPPDNIRPQGGGKVRGVRCESVMW